MNFRDRMTTMKSLLLTLGLLFAVAAWAQEDASDEEETDTQEVAEDAAEEAEDADLDEQDYEDIDDDFRPTEEIPADESIAFPTDI